MSEDIVITLESISKSQVAVCPNCGVLFVKPVKGISGGLIFKRGYYCPVCGEFVCREVTT